MTTLDLVKHLEVAAIEGMSHYRFHNKEYKLPTAQSSGTESQKATYLSQAYLKLAEQMLKENLFEAGFLNIRRAKSGASVSAFLTYVSNGKQFTIKASAKGFGYDKTGSAVSQVFNQSPLVSILNEKYSERVPQTYKHQNEPLEFDVCGHSFEYLLKDLGFSTIIQQDRKYFAIYKNN
jgi:hypothetical protein